MEKVIIRKTSYNSQFKKESFIETRDA